MDNLFLHADDVGADAGVVYGILLFEAFGDASHFGLRLQARNIFAEAADGIEAIEQARRWQPDVVLMDVRMPRLDGVEACRRLVETSDAKVVVLTTFDLFMKAKR